MQDQSRFFVAIFASMAILFGFQYFQSSQEQYKEKNINSKTHNEKQESTLETVKESEPMPILPREQALTSSDRLFFKNNHISGSILIKQGLLDDITLNDYKETLDPKSPSVRLLNPENTENSQYIDVRWVKNDQVLQPRFRLLNQSSDKIELVWDMEVNVQVKRTYRLDDLYVVHVHDEVINNSQENIKLAQKIVLCKNVKNHKATSSSVHEGVVAYLNKTLYEGAVDKLKDQSKNDAATGGWFGLTDQFFLVCAIDDQNVTKDFKFDRSSDDLKATSMRHNINVPSKKNMMVESKFFVGPKVVKILDQYEPLLKAPHLDLAVDFGWFYFLTKPLFFALEKLHGIFHNLGWAIIILTILFKIITLPLGYKSLRSMRRMKSLQPQLEQLKQRCGNDQMQFLQKQRELFKKEKVSPMGGCVPMLMQAPLFFCLYKVFLISIEMRHAPFIGWIQDLSAPDPLSVFNLFGLLPITLPSFLQVGPLPLLMGLTMLIQQKMSPQAAMDESQRKMMLIMPIMFTFLFSSFPAGLVLYWTLSNVLSIVQQYIFEKTSKV